MSDRKYIRPILSFFMILLLLAGLLTGCASDAGTASPQTASANPADTAAENPDDLTVHFLDVGQGDCTVLTQGGHAMMIDAGDNDKGTAVQSYLQYLGIDTLDYVVLTHPDADHIGGADVILYKFDCQTILMPGKETDTQTYDDVIRTMKEKGYRAEHPLPGDTYAFGDCIFTVLSPDGDYPDNNNNSIVLSLTHGENTFLFTGDAEEAAENKMLEQHFDLKADVLKAGHHGSSSSTGDDFLEAVSPSCAVISCGEDNKYGHPHAETMNKFRQMGVAVYRTDEQGTITVTSDGSSLVWNTSPSDSWQVGEPRGSSVSGQNTDLYILNNNTMKFHLPDCGSIEDIKPENKEKSSLSREELIKMGYEPCKRCNP